MTGLASASSTRTVERALALLAEVCDHERVTLAQCARSTHLPPSTALRLLRTLEARSFVRRDSDGSFHAGPRMIQLGAMTFGRQALATIADPALRRIVAECGETVYLLIAGPPGSAMTIGMAEGTFSVRHSSWVGHRIAIGGCAIGRTLAGEVGPLGYLAFPSPAEPDVTAVAAPVERPLAGASARVARACPGGTSAAVAAVISVVGPTYRLDGERVRAVGSVVSREARALARAFDALGAPATSPAVAAQEAAAQEEAAAQQAAAEEAEVTTG